MMALYSLLMTFRKQVLLPSSDYIPEDGIIFVVNDIREGEGTNNSQGSA